MSLVICVHQSPGEARCVVSITVIGEGSLITEVAKILANALERALRMCGNDGMFSIARLTLSVVVHRGSEKVNTVVSEHNIVGYEVLVKLKLRIGPLVRELLRETAM
jgi:hypothetical protein